jgi:hypothetical protein
MYIINLLAHDCFYIMFSMTIYQAIKECEGPLTGCTHIARGLMWYNIFMLVFDSVVIWGYSL